MNDYRSKLKNISTLIFDYDGVLSDSMILFTDDGQQMRNGNVKDGYTIQLAQKMGIRIAIISGALTPGIEKRCELLKIQDKYLGITDKTEALALLMEKHQLSYNEILYMGDDLPDYNVMKMVAIACCPADASSEIQKISHYISPFSGGKGCVRDIIEQVLRSQNKWMTPEAFTW